MAWDAGNFGVVRGFKVYGLRGFRSRVEGLGFRV